MRKITIIAALALAACGQDASNTAKEDAAPKITTAPSDARVRQQLSRREVGIVGEWTVLSAQGMAADSVRVLADRSGRQGQVRVLFVPSDRTYGLVTGRLSCPGGRIQAARWWRSDMTGQAVRDQNPTKWAGHLEAYSASLCSGQGNGSRFTGNVAAAVEHARSLRRTEPPAKARPGSQLG